MLCILAISAAGAARLSFDSDVLSLLPRTGQVIPAFRTFVERFGSLDELYVVFTAPDGQAISDYAGQIDAWTSALRRAPGVARVDTGLVDPSRDLAWLANRQLLVMRGQALDSALDRFRGDGMRAAIAARRDLLAVPSPAVADIVRQDPLGLYDLWRDQLGGANTGMNIGVTEGGYVTPDSRRRLVIVHPTHPPFDTGFSRSLLATIDGIAKALAASTSASPEDDALPPMVVEVTGGHRIAVETEAVIRRESVLNTVVSLALILPLLFFVFRSLWLVAVGPLPALGSLVIVLGLLGHAGTTLSAAATASAAMLFGLGIDGVVLLYVVHALALNRKGPAGEATDLGHLAGPSKSMLLGMWTTAATFYGLTVVDFPSLEQLGMLIGHSMVLCGLLTLVMVPAFLPRRASAIGAAPLTLPGLALWVRRRRVRIVSVSILATIVLGAAAVRVRVNPTLDRLRSVTPGAVLLERIGQQFGLAHDVFVILQRGPDLETLLGANERVSAALSESAPLVPLHAASTLLPSQAAQSSRAEVVVRAAISPAAIAEQLESTARNEGFRPGSFAPFRERLPLLLAPTPRLTYDGYVEHGLGDLIGRFVARDGRDWLVASYAFPPTDGSIATLRRIVGEVGDGAVLTGVSLVNQELASRFLPEFLKGLGVGTVLVVILIAASFRTWRLSLLALSPAAIGLVWAAGLLALARIELDLFAVFAVVTFVGIGVDYGVHLVHRYRDHRDAERATAELAPVILVAAAITVLGYGTLVMSSYPPLRSIGLVSIVAVASLAAASVLVLPAFLIADPAEAAGAGAEAAGEPGPPKLPRRWTLHGLNNGLIFGATCYSVRTLPAPAAYAIGHVVMWIAWRTMRKTREALAGNLAAAFPDESAKVRERRGLDTLRAYARDTIDFLRALARSPANTDDMFEVTTAQRALFAELLERRGGIIVVTGHYGNWEIGSLLIRKGLNLPLTIVAMAEASPAVNRIRRELRQSLGADTVEVRQSLDTALQIRRRLADNQIVAMLIDRHYGRDRIEVSLLGRRAWFLRTPLLMAYATGSPIVPVFIERRGQARFGLVVGSAIVVSRTAPRDDTLRQAAQGIADALGERIRAHPEFWYHFYRYWDAQRDAYDGLD